MKKRTGTFCHLAGLAVSVFGSGAVAQAPNSFEVALHDCISFVRSHNQQLPDSWEQDLPPEETLDDGSTKVFGEATTADGMIRVLYRAELGTDDGYRLWTCDLDAVDRADSDLAKSWY